MPRKLMEQFDAGIEAGLYLLAVKLDDISPAE